MNPSRNRSCRDRRPTTRVSGCRHWPTASSTRADARLRALWRDDAGGAPTLARLPPDRRRAALGRSGRAPARDAAFLAALARAAGRRAGGAGAAAGRTPAPRRRAGAAALAAPAARGGRLRGRRRRAGASRGWAGPARRRARRRCRPAPRGAPVAGARVDAARRCAAAAALADGGADPRRAARRATCARTRRLAGARRAALPGGVLRSVDDAAPQRRRARDALTLRMLALVCALAALALPAAGRLPAPLARRPAAALPTRARWLRASTPRPASGNYQGTHGLSAPAARCRVRASRTTASATRPYERAGGARRPAAARRAATTTRCTRCGRRRAARGREARGAGRPGPGAAAACDPRALEHYELRPNGARARRRPRGHGAACCSRATRCAMRSGCGPTRPPG
ncbi:MAG: hypothetical protein MZW92_58915 [Comamonadaceae bacterium]|nr:hypothetical protein [Comamonadaceae bacterium]